MNYPDIHGIILCKRQSTYKDFLAAHNLNPYSYKYINIDHDARGYHIDSYPNTLVILLSFVGQSDTWLGEMSKQLLHEFDQVGLVIHTNSLTEELVPIIVNVLRVPELKYLPKYLTHDDALVRTFAQRRFNELTGALPMHGNKFTNCNLRLEEDF